MDFESRLRVLEFPDLFSWDNNVLTCHWKWLMEILPLAFDSKGSLVEKSRSDDSIFVLYVTHDLRRGLTQLLPVRPDTLHDETTLAG